MISNDNYLTICGWMLNELGLKSNELLVYAIIYGFSQDAKNQAFTGSRQYLADWCNASLRTIDNTLSSLVDKGLLEKKELSNGYVQYKALRTTPIKETKVSFEADNNSVSSDEVKDLIEIWNKLGLPQVRNIGSTSKRYKGLVARVKEYGISDVIQAMENASKSDFLMGKNNRCWQITFDWFVMPNNFIKVLDGNYANRNNAKYTKIDEW